MEDKQRFQTNNTRRVHPQERASILSRILFCWQLSVFAEGFKKHFTEENLYRPLKEHESRRLGDKLERLWQEELDFQEHPSLERALRRMFGLEFLIPGLLYFPLHITVTIFQPFLLGKLLDYYSAQQTEISKRQAYLYASLILLLTFLRILTYYSFTLALTALGMKVRIACGSLIYRKCLKLKTSTLQNVTVGHMVNLLSNDVNRFDMAFIFLHFAWIAPLEIAVLVTYFLEVSIGYPGTTGVVIVVVCALLQLILSKKMFHCRMQIALRTDHRIRLINEIICGIQVIKMYTWEKSFATLVEMARKLEIEQITVASYLRAINMSYKLFVDNVFVFIYIVTLFLFDLPLKSQFVFVVGVSYGYLRTTSIVYAPLAIAAWAETKTTMLRIQEFLICDHQKQKSLLKKTIRRSKKVADRCIFKSQHDLTVKFIGITAKNVTVKWDSSQSNAILSGVNFSVVPGELVGVVSAAGGGKSTLLQAILKEIELLKGTLYVDGTISYSSQQPWIFSTSIKQNILFGREMDDNRYFKVIRVCALDHDLSLFPFGDRTLVGERGVMLSGGQKARINLARAVYRDADIYLLDDPLSAVDAHVAKQIFDECIVGFLRDKCVILVTHQIQYLRNVKKKYLLKMGKLTEIGAFEELNRIGEQTMNVDDLVTTQAPLSDLDKPEETKEHRNTDATTWKIYKGYLLAGGRLCLGTMLFLFVFVQVCRTLSDYYITFWVNIEEKPIESKFFTTENCLYIYVGLLAVLLFSIYTMSVMFVKFCTRVSRSLHDKMFVMVLYGPMTFFNNHLSGRILNRFSKDVGTIDEVLPATLFDTLNTLLSTIGITILISVLNYWMLIPTAFLFILLYTYSLVFLTTNRNIKRTEGITRSPVFSHLAASLQGLTTIRASNSQKILEQEFDNHQDLHTSAFYLLLALNATLCFWVDVTCALYVGFVIFSFFLIETETGVGDVGMAIMQSITLIAMTPFGIKMWSQLDTYMTSAERVIEYAELETERDDGKSTVPETWPEQGQVEFQSVSMRYSSNHQFVLKGVSFMATAGEKVGVIGRTGAGKTSLLSALFRLFSFEGKIIIDGVDTKSIPLNALRSKISIIPQEPVLFLGTLRKNLDPFDEFTDWQLWNALEEVELKRAISSLPLGLESRITEGGSNFSVGQRQLLCLVRAMVRSTKIIVLDEATANVDQKTDELIQSTIRIKFRDCTVLTIAHRLHTVIDSDKILVMQSGSVAEFGPPHQLLQNFDGYLYGYVDKSDKGVAEELRNIARTSAEK